MSLEEDPEPSLGGGEVWAERFLEDDFLQPFGSKLSLRILSAGMSGSGWGTGIGGKQHLSLSQGTVVRKQDACFRNKWPCC